MKKLLTLLFTIILTLSLQSQAFTLRGSSNCDSGVYSYTFIDLFIDGVMEPMQIKFSSFTISPDITFKEVSSPSDADIIFDDNANNPDMKVCKSSKGKRIKVYKENEIALFPDYTVSISSNSPNYTIYHNSSTFSIEEAIASIIATWAK